VTKQSGKMEGLEVIRTRPEPPPGLPRYARNDDY